MRFHRCMLSVACAPWRVVGWLTDWIFLVVRNAAAIAARRTRWVNAEHSFIWCLRTGTHTHINCCPAYWWLSIPQLKSQKPNESNGICASFIYGVVVLLMAEKRNESGEKRKRDRERWSLKTMLAYSLYTRVDVYNFRKSLCACPQIPSALLLYSSEDIKIKAQTPTKRIATLSHGNRH